MNLLRFIPIKLTIFLVLGILFGHYVGVAFWPSLSFVVFFLLATVIVSNKKYASESMVFGILALCTTICLGIFLVSCSHPKQQTNHYSHRDVAKSARWTLKITEVLKKSAFSSRYIAEVKGYNMEKASGKILINQPIDASLINFHVDDELTVQTTLATLKSPLNPYQFDYRKYMEYKGIYHQLWLNEGNHIVLENPYITLRGRAANLRRTIVAKLDKVGLEQSELGIIQALFLGQRTDISQELYSSYKDAGAVHILAVSGLHIGILLLFLEFLLRPLALIPNGKTIKLVVIVVLLWCFALLAGLSASVVRAVTMFSFVAYAMYLNRPQNTFNILGLSMFFILLVLDPLLVFDVGFQMSYAAVFAIVWIYPLLQKYWRPKNPIFKKIWQLLSVSIAAQIGVLPIGLYYFHQFPGLFFVSNLVIVPYLGVLLGFGIVMILLILLDWAPDFLIEVFGSTIDLMNTLVGWVAQQESFVLRNISFDGIQLILTYVAIIALVWLLIRRSFKRTLAVLGSILSLVLWSFYTQLSLKQREVLMVGHQTKNSLISYQKGNELRIYTSDSSAATYVTANYQIAQRIRNTSFHSIQNAYTIGSKHLLVIDSSGVFRTNGIAPDYLLMIQSPKVNLERLIDSLHPKMIIADGSNYNSYVKKWQESCLKQKLPFHYTGEKGAFTFKLFF